MLVVHILGTPPRPHIRRYFRHFVKTKKIYTRLADLKYDYYYYTIIIHILTFNLKKILLSQKLNQSFICVFEMMKQFSSVKKLENLAPIKKISLSPQPSINSIFGNELRILALLLQKCDSIVFSHFDQSITC